MPTLPVLLVISATEAPCPRSQAHTRMRFLFSSPTLSAGWCIFNAPAWPGSRKVFLFPRPGEATTAAPVVLLTPNEENMDRRTATTNSVCRASWGTPRRGTQRILAVRAARAGRRGISLQASLHGSASRHRLQDCHLGILREGARSRAARWRPGTPPPRHAPPRQSSERSRHRPRQGGNRQPTNTAVLPPRGGVGRAGVCFASCPFHCTATTFSVAFGRTWSA